MIKKIANAFNSNFINIIYRLYRDYLYENHATTIKMKFVKEKAVDSIINKLKLKLVV